MKIASDDFNKDLSKYIGSRRRLGKPFHIQVYKYVKDTKNRLSKIRVTKPEEKEEETPIEIEIEETEEPQEIEEEYKEIEEEVKKENKPFWSFFTDIFKTEPKEEIGPEKGIEEAEELEEDYKELEEMEENVEELEDEIEEKKESIFRRLFDIFKTEPKEEIIEEVQDEYTLNEDVKDALKILTGWLKQLPPEKLKRFKESEDFEKYKEILKKYNLIK